MLSEDPSLAELVQIGIDSALAGMFKAGPGNVTAYDPISNTAFIKPAIKHASYSANGERTFEALEEIPFVPVVFPRAGGMVFRLPLKPGDTVLLVYCDSSLAEWREGGGVAEPQDARRHSVGYPVAIPGFFPDTKPMSPLHGAEVAAGGAVFGDENSPAAMFVGGAFPGIRFGQLAISPVALAVPLLAYVTAAAAAATAGAAADTANNSALAAIGAALTTIAAAIVPANPGAVTAAATANTAISAAATANAASSTAAATGATAATTAAGAVPSTLVKAL